MAKTSTGDLGHNATTPHFATLRVFGNGERYRELREWTSGEPRSAARTGVGRSAPRPPHPSPETWARIIKGISHTFRTQGRFLYNALKIKNPFKLNSCGAHKVKIFSYRDTGQIFKLNFCLKFDVRHFEFVQ